MKKELLIVLLAAVAFGSIQGCIITKIQKDKEADMVTAHNIELSKLRTENAMLKMTPTPTTTPMPMVTNNKYVNYYNSVFKPHYLGGVGLSYVNMEFESIGDYFITAYCPEECGYRVYSDGSDNYPTGWITSTGTIAHREEEWWVPSTCGINTALLNYGDTFLIDGKVYVAEDTGYVTGRLIDLFKPSYEEMMTHGSHWTEVYSVEYVKSDHVYGWHFDINKFRGEGE